MNDKLRELIELLRTEENMEWSGVAEHFELCHSCGGVPQGNVYGDMPFIECDSDNCDRAFEQMCDDFVDETGNGNSTRCLMGMVYDEMKEHDDLEAFAQEERHFLEGNNISTKDMTDEDLIWQRLSGFERVMLNESIVGYWRDDRGGDAQ